jgi:hypothetical protein
VACFFFFSSPSSLGSPFLYSGCSVARQQLLATSLRLDNRALLGAGHSSAPDLLLAKSGFGADLTESSVMFTEHYRRLAADYFCLGLTAVTR